MQSRINWLFFNEKRKKEEMILIYQPTCVLDKMLNIKIKGVEELVFHRYYNFGKYSNWGLRTQ